MDDLPVCDDTTVKDPAPPCCDPFTADWNDDLVPLPATGLQGARCPRRPTWWRWVGPLLITTMLLAGGIGLFLTVR